MNPGWSMPRDVSQHGARIDTLIHTTLVLVTVLFVIMVAWMAISALRHGEEHRAVYSHGTSRRSAYAKLGVGAAIFFGVDGNLFVNSTRDLHDSIWNFKGALAHPDAVRIEVNAHQWAWDARYAGPDGQFNTKDDIVTLNDIRVPVGVPVVFQLAAVDVLHCFYIPNLRVKQDVVPGTLNRAWFEARETGEFEIACAQHCGTNHYKMRGMITVLSREEWSAWAKEASAAGARAYNPEDEAAHWGWAWKDE
jgi:cytochrome c oxidase subunit 2